MTCLKWKGLHVWEKGECSVKSGKERAEVCTDELMPGSIHILNTNSHGAGLLLEVEYGNKLGWISLD